MTQSGILSSANEYIGFSGNGTFTQENGQHNVSGALYMGTQITGSGTYEMTSGTLSSPDGSLILYAGHYGSGNVSQSGGTIQLGAGSLFLGHSDNSAGTYVMTGSASLSAVNETVGLNGTGTFTQTNGTNQVTSTLLIAQNLGSSGTYNLEGGTLTAALIDNNGQFNMEGGVFNGDLNNKGQFRYHSGTFNGSLQNNGTTYLYNSLNVVDGIVNNTNFAVSSGKTLTAGGTGFDNNGSLSLDHGSLFINGSSIRLSNHGTLSSGEGTITGSGAFYNYGLVTQEYGALTLANSASTRNYGTFDLRSGYQLRITGGGLYNYGTVNLNNAVVTGTYALTNSAGGTLAGPGTISSAFSNTGGRLVVGPGNTNITQAFPNSGQILLTDDFSSLNGEAITNTGTIEGLGVVGNNITNTGIIEAIGGTLNLGGTVCNNAAGLMTAASGGKILVSNGLFSNTGQINLNGGTFDNNGRAMTSQGQISGYGIFRSGGLTNTGSAVFTGGNTTVNGNVTNNGTIKAAYNPITFTGNFINNGTFKNTETTVTFIGTYQENGTFISDPAVTYFQDITIGKDGALIGGEINGEYDKWYVSNNFLNFSTNNSLWDTDDAFIGFTGTYDGTQEFYLASKETGANASGYQNNFAWGYFDIAPASTITLFDGNTDNTGTALYVESLTGIRFNQGKVSNISGDYNIYYLTELAGNNYLGGLTYEFLNGFGKLIPVAQGAPVPVPGSILLMISGLACLAGLRRR